MLDLVYNQEIVKSDRKIFVGNKVYCRSAFTLGIRFQHGIACLVGVLYFPPEGNALLFDEKFHPIAEKIAVLKSKYQDDWIDRYTPPKENHYDVAGELTFSSLTKLRDELVRLNNTLDCRLVCSNAESDFAYSLGKGVIPVIGDRPYLLSHANQILSEDRCETSNACKRVLSRDEPALLALGCAFSSLERMSFYDFSSSYSETREMSLVTSYS
jgi:hypothetical protein